MYSYGLSPHFLFLSLSHHDFNSTSSTHNPLPSISLLLVVNPTFARTIKIMCKCGRGLKWLQRRESPSEKIAISRPGKSAN